MSLSTAYTNGAVSSSSDDPSEIMQATLVPGFRLDDILSLDRLDLIKIDVEGHEFSALQGFLYHIVRFRPVIVSEFTPGSMVNAQGYLSLFFSLGYSISIIESDGSYTDCGQSSDEVMRSYKLSGVDHIDIVAIPPVSI